MLSCIDLSFKLNEKVIFSNFSISLLPGAIYILKGVNGSGKTSLLKIIAGIIKPTTGYIYWNNKIINSEQYYKNICYLGHENAIKDNLTVLENLSLWTELKDNFLLLNPAIAHFKLTNLINEKCKYLSLGWKKRIALARMIISNTTLWLLDEPEANLDEEGRELLLKLLQVKIASGGIAIIASHNLESYQKIPVIHLKDFKI